MTLPVDPSVDTADMEVLFAIQVQLAYGGIDISSDYIVVNGTASLSSDAILTLVVDIPGRRCVFIDTGVKEVCACASFPSLPLVCVLLWLRV